MKAVPVLLQVLVVNACAAVGCDQLLGATAHLGERYAEGESLGDTVNLRFRWLNRPDIPGPNSQRGRELSRSPVEVFDDETGVVESSGNWSVHAWFSLLQGCGRADATGVSLKASRARRYSRTPLRKGVTTEREITLRGKYLPQSRRAKSAQEAHRR